MKHKKCYRKVSIDIKGENNHLKNYLGGSSRNSAGLELYYVVYCFEMLFSLLNV